MPRQRRPNAAARFSVRQALYGLDRAGAASGPPFSWRRNAMRISEPAAVNTLDSRVWRDLTLLAAQGLAIGIAASVLLGLAVVAVM